MSDLHEIKHHVYSTLITNPLKEPLTAIEHFQEYVLDTSEPGLYMSIRRIPGCDCPYLYITTDSELWECDPCDFNTIDRIANEVAVSLGISKVPNIFKYSIYGPVRHSLTLTRLVLEEPNHWVDVFTIEHDTRVYAIETIPKHKNVSTEVSEHIDFTALDDMVAPTELVKFREIKGVLFNPTVMDLHLQVQGSKCDPSFCYWYIHNVCIWLAGVDANVRNKYKTLDLSWCKLYDDDFDMILEMIELLPNLEYVNLEGCNFSGSLQHNCSVTRFLRNFITNSRAVINISCCEYATNHIPLIAVDRGYLPVAALDRVMWLCEDTFYDEYVTTHKRYKTIERLYNKLCH